MGDFEIRFIVYAHRYQSIGSSEKEAMPIITVVNVVGTGLSACMNVQPYIVIYQVPYLELS